MKTTIAGVSKGGRPATGSARWNPTAKYWEARVTKIDGGRGLVPARGVPACLVVPNAPPKKCPCDSCAQAKRVAKIISDRHRNDGLVSEYVGETANEWYERYLTIRALKHETRGMGAWNRWCETIGTSPIDAIKPEQVKTIRNSLRQAAVFAEDISPKRAMNLWSELITAPFSRAFTDDDLDYESVRVGPANANPALGVKPPVTKKEIEEGERERQALFARDFVKLISCGAIPLEWRRLYAVAVFLYLRPEELYALRWTNVDFEACEVRVRIALDLKSGDEKPTKTKAGRRSVPIHANLLSLLVQMQAEARSRDARIFPLPKGTGVREVEKNVAMIRAHLKLAGVDRPELLDGSDSLRPVDFRSLRTTGITWLAMLGTDSNVIASYAGHDKPDVTWGSYIKQGPDLRRRHGEPFPSLHGLIQRARGSGSSGGGFGVLAGKRPKTPRNSCEGGDLNPYGFTR